MDRTSEFNSILSKNPNQPAGRSSSAAEDPEGIARSSFNNEAARIGQEIHVAQLKLDELGKCMINLTLPTVQFHSGTTEEHFQ